MVMILNLMCSQLTHLEIQYGLRLRLVTIKFMFRSILASFPSWACRQSGRSSFIQTLMVSKGSSFLVRMG